MRHGQNLIYISAVPLTSTTYTKIINLKENSEKILNRNIQMINTRDKPGELISFLRILFNRSIGQVHIFEPFSLSFIFLIPFRIFGKTIIYQTSGLHSKASVLKEQGFFWRILISASEHVHIYLSNFVIVDTLTAKKIFTSEFGLDEGLVLAIPDGVNKHEPEEYTHYREKVNISKISIVYSADLRCLYFNKELRSLGWELPFIAYILKNLGYHNFKINILGDGPGMKYLSELIKRLMVEDCVVLLGRIGKKDYNEVLEKADICFSESVEHISYAVMNPTQIKDYIEHSKPIVAGSIGWVSELPDGLFIKVQPAPLDVHGTTFYLKEIVEQIIPLLDNQQCIKKYSDSVTVFKNTLPSWKEVANELCMLYNHKNMGKREVNKVTNEQINYKKEKNSVSILIISNEPEKIGKLVEVLEKNDFPVILSVDDIEKFSRYRERNNITLVESKSKHYSVWRNIGAHYARTEYLAHIDSDEMPDDTLIHELKSLDGIHDAYYVKENTYFGNRRLRMWTIKKLKIIRTNRSFYYGRVHEHLERKGLKIGNIDGIINNYSYVGWQDYWKKVNKITEMENKNIFNSVYNILKSTYLYFGNGGILDGILGLRIYLASLKYSVMILTRGKRNGNVSVNKSNVNELLDRKDVNSLTSSEKGYIPYLKTLLILMKNSKDIQDIIDQIRSIIEYQHKVS